MSLPTQNKPISTARKRLIWLFKLIVYAMLGTLMFTSKILMEALPNIHLLGMLTMAYTVAFGVEALIPIYVYVMLNGLYAGFDPWWVPYLYIWTLLWGVTMLLPRRMPTKVAAVVYPIVCALHGFLYGTLYAPAQAWMWHLDARGTVAWIVAGLPYDALHGVSNLILGCLVLPFSALLIRLMRRYGAQ